MKLISSIILVLFFVLPFNGSSQQNFDKKLDEKVDSLLNSMTLREKIGQLVMIEVYSDRDEKYNRAMLDTISWYKPGSIVFFKGSPFAETKLLNDLQNVSDIPMLVAIDAEWGVAMRLDSVVSMPRFMALAATRDSVMIYNYGKILGQQCKRLGIHINFAPVVDVNSNPLNPVINYRSLGENQHLVAKFSRWFCAGIMSEGVMPVAKHFPGHGNTSQDSHKTLPNINENLAVIDSVHLLPFREMVSDNVWGIMVAHVYAPALDNTYLLPSSLSRKIIYDLLRVKMQYKGLIITDALMMRGVTRGNRSGSIEVQALQAGNDLLLMPQDIILTLDSVEKAVLDGRISMEQIDESVRKVLKTKFELGLFEEKPVDLKYLSEDLNKESYFLSKQNIFDKAVTLVFDRDSLLPLPARQGEYSIVSFYINKESAFHQEAKKFTKIRSFFIPDPKKKEDVTAVLNKISAQDTIILCVHQMSYWTRNNYKFTSNLRSAIYRFVVSHKVILCLMGNPYAYRSWTYSIEPSALVVAYERDLAAEIAVAKAVFGSNPFKGVLPVSINKSYPAGTGLQTKNNAVLKEVSPTELGYDLTCLNEIDLIVEKAIQDTIFPGCQILAVKEGNVFYNKSFGYHTYDSIIKVENSHLYDLASVTKMLATTLAVMKLYDDSLLDIQAPLAQYLSLANETEIGKVNVDRILTHSSGLPPWKPYHKYAMIDGELNPKWFSVVKNNEFPLQVSDQIFIKKEYSDSVVQWILRTKLKPDQGYKYSDLGFILLKSMVEEISETEFEEFLTQNFYNSLGLNRLMFNPLRKFNIDIIPPTEQDTSFRNQLVHGYVHDQNAALFGGVSGQAGLFSNSWDIAVIMQMLLQEGSYAGVHYLKAQTIKKFTTQCFDKNRRGLGFDKSSRRKNGNTCMEVSPSSYGHSGFTGIYVWSDPENDLIYIFLSNRVYPDAENWKIIKQNIRTRIHSLLYKAVLTS